jgi:hypothetical protein
LLIEILKHTPHWVFGLFVVLLAAGCVMSKDRVISRRRISILPAAMVALSFYGVLSASGIAPAGLISWASGLGIAAAIGARLAPSAGVRFSTETHMFSVPGSWLPLASIMAIFFTKYAVAVVQARQLPIADDWVFIASISLCYGFLSGVFVGRSLAMRGLAKRSMEVMSNRTTPQASR